LSTRRFWAAVATLGAAASAAYALTTPSASDGPIRLLGCVVTPAGVLEANVESQADEAMDCNIRCNYQLEDRNFSHTFNVTIPKRFQGRIGRFDTNNAKAGTYSGEVGTCKKVSS